MRMIQKTLRDNLRRLRAEHGLSQDQLAERAGLSNGYVAQVESGRVWVSLHTIGNLAKALKCEESELFYSGERKVTPSEALDCLQTFVSRHSGDLEEGVPVNVLEALNEAEWDPDSALFLEAAIRGVISGFAQPVEKAKSQERTSDAKQRAKKRA